MKTVNIKRYTGSVIILLFLFFFLIQFSACRKSNDDTTDPAVTKKMQDLVVPATFNWSTTTDISLEISARDNQGTPLKNIRMNILTKPKDQGGVLLFSGATDEQGMLTVTQKFPSYLTELTVANDYLGLIREQTISILGGKITCDFGGKVPEPVHTKGIQSLVPTNLPGVWVLGTYSSNGVPNYLESPNDVVDAALLNDINASLPEQQPVPTYHPQYLASTATSNLPILELCDVTATFITEGAGWLNNVGFFSFPTDQPPTSASQIDTIKMVFPNMSQTGSGGGLNPGNKVKLGRFPAGVSIGWVVFANGWQGGQITNGNYRIYSIASLNPEPNVNLKKHTVLLRDAGRHEVLFAFEDWRRDQGSDQDFNDGIIYVKSTPVNAINTDDMPPIDNTQPDSDGDEIPNVFDDYPNDPTKAFDNYYPSKTGYGSLAFEDLWPGEGDYDFNDLVISYRFNQITNAQNKVVQVKALFIPEAMGALYHNGFAFQMPIAPDQVSSVSGFTLTEGYITQSANNTEAGQSKAVVVVFDDTYQHLPPPGVGTIGTNTELGAPYVTPDTINIIVNLVSPVSLSIMGTPPYNPFIIVDKNRNREVHLSDKPPTDKVDGTEFGTGSDDSNPSTGRYYKTKTNLPWGINIVGKFDYVIEKEEITAAFLKFAPWAESGGTLFQNWYLPEAGFRDNSKIYTH